MRFLAGVDEAGVGSLAGPVMAAALILKTNKIEVMVNDSKCMTEPQRLRASHWLSEHAWIGVGVVDPEIIDRINIFQARLLAMQIAVLDLPIPPARVLVDGLHAPDFDMPAKAIVNGDQKIKLISCASIIAKVRRDELMRTQHQAFPQYGFDRNKGYGTPEHLNALSKYGPCPLHRKTFAPVRRVLELEETKFQSAMTTVT